MALKLKTKHAILEAAFLTLNETPGASLGDVAARAGVGRATLHRHYPSRQALLEALAETAMDELDDAITQATENSPTYTDALRHLMEAAIPLAHRQWFLSNEDFSQSEVLTKRREAEVAELLETLDAVRAEGRFAPDLPTKWIAEVYENLIYAAWTMVRDGEATPRQAADLAWRSFLNGVSP